MAVSAVMAAVSTGFTALSGGALLGGFLLGAGAAGTLFTHFLVTTAMGAALNALTPKPKLGESGSGGYSIQGASGSALGHQVIYGETRVGGVRAYDVTASSSIDPGEVNNEFLHRILIFAGHEIDSYQQIYLNDEVVTLSTSDIKYTLNVNGSTGTGGSQTFITSVYTIVAPAGFSPEYDVSDVLNASQFSALLSGAVSSTIVSGFETTVDSAVVTAKESTFAEVISPERYRNHVWIEAYEGTDTQLANPILITETAGLTSGQWTSDHRLQGLAYLYVRFRYSADVFPNGVPSVSATIRGKKVYDPRTETVAWSDNPALCLRDFLTNDYGLDQPSTRIDDQLVINAANICDQVVESESRYSCNGAFVTGGDPSELATDLLSSMGGLLWYGQGKWRMKAAAWTAPSVSFDENDLRSGISLSTRHSRRDNFNSVKGTFRGPESDWQAADYPEVTDPAFLAADGGFKNVLDFPLPFTTSSLTAQRIARIALNRNREQLTFNASFGLRAFQVQVGDFVNITNTRFGWTDKAFEVVEWTFGLSEDMDIQVKMTLREISEEVFTGADGEFFEGNNTTLPSPFTGLTITDLFAEERVALAIDGTIRNRLFISWTGAESRFIDYYEVTVTPYNDAVPQTSTQYTTRNNSIEVPAVEEGLTYIVTVRAYTTLGNAGPIVGVSAAGSTITKISLIINSRNADGSPRVGVLQKTFSTLIDAPMLIRTDYFVQALYPISGSATVSGLGVGGAPLVISGDSFKFTKTTEAEITAADGPFPYFSTQIYNPTAFCNTNGAAAELVIRQVKTYT